jgi:hypothetical protein
MHDAGKFDIILKVGQMIKLKQKKMRGDLANLRTVYMLQRGETLLSDRFHLAYADGDELINSKLKG